MIKYLLETNICIYVIKRCPMKVLAKFNDAAEHIAIPSITLSELLHGVEKSQYVSKNLKAVEDFCSRLALMIYMSQVMPET